MAGVQNFALRVNEDGFVLMPGIDQNLDRTSGAGHPNPNEEHSVKRHPLGTILVDPSGGRAWRYGLNGGVALGAGKLVQSEVHVAHHEDMPAGTEPADETTISITPPSTDVPEDDYDEGFLWVNDAAGEGEIHRVLTTPAISAGATGNIELYANDPIVTAFEAATTVSLIRHAGAQVIVHPSPPTAGLYGVPNIPITAAYYGWFQFRGPCPVLLDDGSVAFAAGNHVRASDGVDGAVEFLDRDGSGENEPEVGVCLVVSVDTEYGLINLTLPGI
jgi:hypothetical protein